MSKFQLYDAVRILSVPNWKNEGVESRPPRVGDIGVVVMVYDSPREGYGVEGVGSDGRAEWL